MACSLFFRPYSYCSLTDSSTTSTTARRIHMRVHPDWPGTDILTSTFPQKQRSLTKPHFNYYTVMTTSLRLSLIMSLNSDQLDLQADSDCRGWPAPGKAESEIWLQAHRIIAGRKLSLYLLSQPAFRHIVAVTSPTCPMIYRPKLSLKTPSPAVRFWSQ